LLCARNGWRTHKALAYTETFGTLSAGRYNAAMRRELGIVAALALVTAAAYWPVTHAGFINFDDPGYIRDNPPVRQGLTWDGLAWAFTTHHQSNWHPLTWLSHMLDCQMFGPHAGPEADDALAAAARGHHVTSLLIHIAAAVALFFALKRMTRAAWPSAAVAALFVLHPEHVESVAWLSERKDVLSTFFGMLALLAYARYAERPGLARYAAVAVLFAFALMAKPMLVTLPFLLLLVDWWPLGRFRFQSSTVIPSERRRVEESRRANVGGLQRTARPLGFARGDSEEERGARGEHKANTARLVLEKLPLFLLAAASSVVTFLAQGSGTAMDFGRHLTFLMRLGNAAVAYATYLAKTLVPIDLALQYPYPQHRPAWEVPVAAAVLAAATGLALWAARRRPYVTVGWFWFLGTLVPAIGLVQVGAQSMADRYTYVPLIGLFIALAWGAAEVASRPSRRRWVAAAGGAAIAACALLTMLQARTWTTSEAVFSHSLAVAPDNPEMHNMLGVVLAGQKRFDEARAQFMATGDTDKHLAAMAHSNLADILREEGRRREDVLAELQLALSLDPNCAEAHYNLALNLLEDGKPAEALPHLTLAVQAKPTDALMRSCRAATLLELGREDDAAADYAEALRLDPDSAPAHHGLAAVLMRQGKVAEAATELRAAIASSPDRPETRFNLGVTLELLGKPTEAAAQYRASVALAPDNPLPREKLATLLVRQGEAAEAVKELRAVVSLAPDRTEAMNTLAWILATHPDGHLRDGKEAVALAEAAVARIGPDDAHLAERLQAMDTLAAAYAEAGRFDKAISVTEEVLAKAQAAGLETVAAEARARLALYRAGKPYREAPGGGVK
jgi:Flp pilus assembly protein TadD